MRERGLNAGIPARTRDGWHLLDGYLAIRCTEAELGLKRVHRQTDEGRRRYNSRLVDEGGALDVPYLQEETKQRSSINRHQKYQTARKCILSPRSSYYGEFFIWKITVKSCFIFLLELLLRHYVHLECAILGGSNDIRAVVQTELGTSNRSIVAL